MRISRMVKMALLALAAASPAQVAQAAEIEVTRCGEGDLRTALASAAADDTVRLACDGTIVLDATEITLNTPLTLDATGRSVTIAGRGPQSVFFISTPGQVTLRGLTIRNGQDADGGVNGGGGIYHASGTLVLDHVRMVGNHAHNRGGAVHSIGNTARLVVRDSVFEDNAVTCGALCGNDGGGGAIAAAGVRGTLIERSTFRRNEVVGLGSGGAVFVPVVFRTGMSPLVVRDSVFEENRATTAYIDPGRPPKGGGAIASIDRETVLERNVFVGNLARPYPDGVQSEGGAVLLTGLDDPAFPGGPATVTDNVFEENAATGPAAAGGALAVRARTATVTGMRAIGNRSTRGGALAAITSTVDLRDALLSGSSATGAGGLTGSALFAFGATIAVSGVDAAGGDGDACAREDVLTRPALITDGGGNFEAPGATCGFAPIARPTLTAGTATVRAPLAGTAATVDVPLTLSAALPYDLDVAWRAADGSEGVVTIPGGATSVAVPVVVRGSAPVAVALTLLDAGRTVLAGDGTVRVEIAPEPAPVTPTTPAAAPAAPAAAQPAPTPAAAPRGCRGTGRVTYRATKGSRIVSAVRLTRSGKAKPVLYTRTRVVVDLRNLRPGTYPVRITLRTKAGRLRTVTKRYAVCGG